MDGGAGAPGASGGSVLSVEHFGPTWSSGPFELGTDGPQVIMVGVEGSPTAMRAAAYAAGLARRQRSRLLVVYVSAPSVWEGMSPVPLGAAMQEAVEQITAELGGMLRSQATELGVPVTFMVRSGDPLIELRKAATEAQADMVVVGASTKTGHRLVGSLATRLVRLGRWPVTVVP